MKKILKIASILLIILITAYLGYKILIDKQSSVATVSEDVIKNPDRIIFKTENNYYEITKNDENYAELIENCRQSFNETKEYSIIEKDIDSMKSEKDFIEFDYDKISKNNIFFLYDDIGIVKMNGTDGKVISKKLQNSASLLEKFKTAVADKKAYDFKNYIVTAKNTYSYLPSTMDFEEIKNEKVYKKELASTEEYEEIIKLYKLEFDNINIGELLKENKVILFLSKYDIEEYKINIGNIQIKFAGTNHIVPVFEEYTPVLMIVSKIVNTNCIYYNYDNIETKDNLTGTTEEISAIVKSKNDDGTFNLAYVCEPEMPTIGILNVPNSLEIENLEVGDSVQVIGIIENYSNNIKTYNAQEIHVYKKEEYEKNLNEMLKGTTKLDTDIIEYYQAESGYDGYVICSLYFGENSYSPDGYIKIYYDFYNGNTESYLGMTNHLQSNYGIVKNEIVTITFDKPVNDIHNINAKMFEYIAD